MRANVGSGDRGMTSLLSGERVPKTHPRVEACGDIDELASVLGALASALPAEQSGTRREIEGVQGVLLQAGALLAATGGSSAAGMLRPVTAEDTRVLEQAIDRMESTLPPLQGFLIPGGHPSAAWAHVARTVCRRAERRVVAIPPTDAPGLVGVIPFLNRLSTYLFALARTCNAMHGVAEAQWKG